MLTKNLLRYRRASGYVKPKFIETDDEKLLKFADSLIQVYDFEIQPSRSDIEEQVMPLVNGENDITLAKGLNKLILDRCEFAHPHCSNLSVMRREVFNSSSKYLENLSKVSDKSSANVEDLYSFVSEQVEEFRGDEDLNLYGDLPEFEKLIKLKPITSSQLLERYNVALVQSLLIHSSSMTIILREPSTAKLRRLFKYLKFFGLLATIYLEETTKKALDRINKLDDNNKIASKLRIEIDGPLSLFENTTKYGIRLASFFPAVCDMKKWQLKTNVKVDNKNHKLSLDESAELKSFYRNFSAYVPEEIKVFHRVFNEKVPEWSISGDTPFIKVKGQEIIFPDLCFTRHEDGKTVFLELFHRWHTWQLKQRLDYLVNHENIIIGIDRSLYKNSDVQQLVDNSGVLDSKAFLFNDFPSCSAVKRILD